MLKVREIALRRLFIHDGELFGSLQIQKILDFEKCRGKVGYPTEYKRDQTFPRGVSETADQPPNETCGFVLCLRNSHIGPPVSTKTQTGS